MSILLFILILLVLVVVHELGHFFAAKSYGVRVDEFGVGYPPRAKVLFRKWGTDFTLNWIPFGGFVKIFGENPDQESTEGPDRGRSLVNKPRYQQAVVLVAGIVFNLFFAWLLFSIAFMAGVPSSTQGGMDLKDTRVTIISIQSDSPADTAGLVPGDELRFVNIKNEDGSISKEPINTPEDLKRFVRISNGTPIEFLVGKDETPVIVTPDQTEDSATIGVSIDTIGTAQYGFFKSFVEGGKATINVTVGTAKAFAQLIGGVFNGTSQSDSLSGPIGIARIVGDASRFGASYLISFSALISINLAIINLFPFPALDGGRLLFLGVEAIRGKKMNQKVFNMANTIGFGILILLMVFITVKDVLRLI